MILKIKILVLCLVIVACNGQVVKEQQETLKISKKQAESVNKEKLALVKLPRSENWNGDYYIKTKTISEATLTSVDIEYFINIKGDKAILSIGAKNIEDYWCEGDYFLQKGNGYIYAKGKCEENDINDFMIKKIKSQYFIKSKKFSNKDWQNLDRSK